MGQTVSWTKVLGQNVATPDMLQPRAQNFSEILLSVAQLFQQLEAIFLRFYLKNRDWHFSQGEQRKRYVGSCSFLKQKPTRRTVADKRKNIKQGYRYDGM